MLFLKLYQETALPLHNPHPLDISFIVFGLTTKFHTFTRLRLPSNACSESKLPPFKQNRAKKKKDKKHNLLIETTISYTTYINTWTLQEQELEQEQGQAGTEQEEEQEQEGSSDWFGPYWEIMLLFVFASLCLDAGKFRHWNINSPIRTSRYMVKKRKTHQLTYPMSLVPGQE